MVKVCFYIQRHNSEGPAIEKSIEVPPGTKITQAAHLANVQIAQTCGGTPSCTDCTVKILSQDPDVCEAMQGAEARLLGNVYHITKERLACQAVIKKSIEISIPIIKVTKREERE